MKLKMIIPVCAFAGLTLSCGEQRLASGIDTKNLDTSIKPGDDFYQYACGGWMKQHPLPAEYSRYGTFEMLIENNDKQVRGIIEDIASKKQSDGTNEQKLAGLYNLYMDSTRRNKEGIEPLRKYVDMLNGLKAAADIMPMVGTLEHMGFGGMYFYNAAVPDEKNSEYNIVAVGQSGLMLGQKEYYLDNDPATVKIRKAFRQYLVDILKLYGETPEAAEKKADYSLAIQTALAKASRTATELRDPEKNYNKMPFAQFTKTYSAIDWNKYFKNAGYPEFKSIDVGQPEFLKAVESALSSFPMDAHKAYMETYIIDKGTEFLSDTLRHVSFNFYGKIFSGQAAEKPSWRRAVKFVQGIMGEGLGKLYVDKYFPKESKERMLKLVKNLQTSLGQRINAQTWMSDSTKANAQDKLKTFIIKIGYPDKWQDYSKLKIDTTLSLLDNYVNASKYANDYEIARTVNKKVDRTRWYMYPQTVNAYYSPETNEICFPAGILQPPFFDPEADDAFNYGAIGVVIGHEMTHGFDDQGRQYDKNGNLRNWWTASDAENFKKRTQVLSDYFSNIEVLPGLKANGALTLGENLADHGGLQVAFNALQNAMKENPLDTADGYTPEQRFFLAYANVWANNISDAQIRQRTKSDPHALGKWRVDGTLPHIDAWYKAFNVTEKDKMFVPKDKRLDIW